jgi:hypothetical protein
MASQHWWVNHASGDLEQIAGSYLWWPQKNPSGARTLCQHNMLRMIPGDLVFSHAATQISALGVVLDRARGAPNPAPGAAVPLRPGLGWLVPVRFTVLRQPLHPQSHWTELAPLLPRRRSPLRESGASDPKVFLSDLAPALAKKLRALLHGQVEEFEERVALETDGRLADLALEEQIWQRANVSARAKRDLIDARTGHGLFRERLESIETACRVTGILDRRYLCATHIKPWRDADDRERLDGCNGLLLSPHLQQLFQRGHISFADDGALLISRHLNPFVRSGWGLQRPAAPRAFRIEQRGYLAHHRQHVFERVGAGRRSPPPLTLLADRVG